LAQAWWRFPGEGVRGSLDFKLLGHIYERTRMKIVFEDGDIERIADRVVEKLKPLLNKSRDSKDDELMDVQGLSKYLKVAKSWVYSKVHLREIPFRKAGKYPRFKKKDIDLWLLNPYHPELEWK
jgi:excisionase family DNA binding protein